MIDESRFAADESPQLKHAVDAVETAADGGVERGEGTQDARVRDLGDSRVVLAQRTGQDRVGVAAELPTDPRQTAVDDDRQVVAMCDWLGWKSQAGGFEPVNRRWTVAPQPGHDASSAKPTSPLSQHVEPSSGSNRTVMAEGRPIASPWRTTIGEVASV
jgi:hypothetical protein